MKAFVSAFSFFAIIGLLTAGCGGGDADTTSAPATETTEPAAMEATGDAVELTLVESAVQDGRLQLRGTTSLPDGALVSYVVEHEGFASGDFDGYFEGLMTVVAGGFSQALDVDGWPSGHATARLSFSMRPEHGGEQPLAVAERFGAQGERLEGPDVVQFGDTRRLETRADIDLP